MSQSRAPSVAAPVRRTDLLRSNLTASKARQVHDLVDAYRKGALLLGREQWRLFFESGKFNRNHDTDKATFASVVGAANRVQMARYQVVGQLQAWIGNRASEFLEVVRDSTLDTESRHMLHTINQRAAWFARDDVKMYHTGELIPPSIRHLARSIMRAVMARHRRPDLSRLSMRLDRRAAPLTAPKRARQGGRVAWWVNLSTMQFGRKIRVPLLGYEHHERRLQRGRLCQGIEISRDVRGHLSFAVVIDESEACAVSRAAYEPRTECIAVDFGLSGLFATYDVEDADGQILSQDWLRRLQAYDRQIGNLARGAERRRLRLRQSPRFRAVVNSLRGFLRTEVGRVFNRLVATRRPASLAMKRLDFRHPKLSRRMNALLLTHGKAVMEAKLADLSDRFWIGCELINPSYASQICPNPSCGYVDKRNRSASGFRCLWCGKKMHADLVTARQLWERRASPFGIGRERKAAVLVELVTRFEERQARNAVPRRAGSRDAPADPRSTNPHFRGASLVAPRMSTHQPMRPGASAVDGRQCPGNTTSDQSPSEALRSRSTGLRLTGEA